MSAPFDGAGLSLDQAPPLSVPARYFLLAPVALVGAGALLSWRGASLVASPWVPETAALVHLGTLGFLASVMLGALLQMTPVVAGSPVPAIRGVGAMFVAWVVGVGGLAFGLGGAGWWAAPVLGVALAGVVGPVAVALARSEARTDTVHGMRLAVASLVAVAVIGGWLAWGHATGSLPAARPALVRLHLTLALLGWVGGLILSVSWQVVPMFYLAAETPSWARRGMLVALGAGLLGSWHPLGAGLAAAVVLVAHPVATLEGLRRRRRRRADASLLGWRLGLGVALALPPVVAVAWWSPDPRWALLAGWLAIWGWAGSIVRAMLSRIVPFLVWFHRFSHRVGEPGAPTMRDLLPQGRIRLGVGLHAATLGVGALAIGLGGDGLARLTGALLLAAGMELAVELGSVLRRG